MRPQSRASRLLEDSGLTSHLGHRATRTAPASHEIIAICSWNAVLGADGHAGISICETITDPVHIRDPGQKARSPPVSRIGAAFAVVGAWYIDEILGGKALDNVGIHAVTAKTDT